MQRDQLTVNRLAGLVRAWREAETPIARMKTFRSVLVAVRDNPGLFGAVDSVDVAGCTLLFERDKRGGRLLRIVRQEARVGV